MTTQHSLETRVEALEAALLRTRRFALFLAAVLVFLVSAAFGGQEDEIRTSKLILMEGGVVPGISLVSGPGSSLVLQKPDGTEILRLGGSPLRRIGED